ncbi:hypothetical protein AVEN_187092-1 [Araneus ventricosus]|uniref:Uncharacterized protein n=1 Tax=Araneus ventricosus TaxID=182803 RepID=A0A4Y2Q9G8_ARAVE|nr:hypothetical protein AVEN_187092-1 [Araneus ventricosus]
MLPSLLTWICYRFGCFRIYEKKVVTSRMEHHHIGLYLLVDTRMTDCCNSGLGTMQMTFSLLISESQEALIYVPAFFTMDHIRNKVFHPPLPANIVELKSQ